MSSTNDRAAGKLPPALLQFNRTLRRNHVVFKVRAWVCVVKADSVNHYRIADRIISEARTRIMYFHDAPLDALATAAVLNTIVYLDNSADFVPLVAQAREAFASVL
jgi:hypothetical protein